MKVKHDLTNFQKKHQYDVQIQLKKQSFAYKHNSN